MSTSRFTRSGRPALRGVIPALFLLAACSAGAPERPVGEVIAEADAGKAEAVPVLIGYFGHPDGDTVQMAWEAAVRLGGTAEGALVAALDSPDRTVSEHAAGALGAIRSEDAVEALEKALEKPDFRRYVAAWALGEIGNPGAVPALVEALGDEDGETRKYAARALVKFGPEGVPALIEALGSPSPWRRRYAVRALGEIRDPRAAGPLLGMEGEVDREVFLWALGRIGDPRGYSVIAAAAEDPDWRIRLAAVQALGDLANKEAVPALTGALGDEEWIIREWAARGLESVTGDRLTYRDQKGEDVYPYNLYR